MAPMHRPVTTAVLVDEAGFEAVSEQVTASGRAAPAQVAGVAVPLAVARQVLNQR